MNELYLIKSGDNGFVEETSAVISADSGEISINDSLYVESAGNIGIGSSNPVNKLDVVGSASISSDLTVNGITFSNVGGRAPSAPNDIIMYDGSDWVVAAASQLPGGGGGAGNSDVPAGLINTLTQGQAIHEVNFGFDDTNARIVYDNVPKIAASLEIDGPGEIIPHTVSGVSESGYFVVFSEELPTANYRMHTVFGGTDAFWETGVANLEYSERSVDITRSLYVGQKVGIGTTNPDAKLDLQTSDHPLYIRSGAGANDNLFLFENPSAGPQFRMYEKGTSNVAVKLSTHNNSYFNGGNVGIGATNPDRNLVIDAGVNSSPLRLIARSSDENCAIQIRNSANTNTVTQLGGNIDSYFTGGNVGIGTTNPGEILVIQDSSNPRLQIRDGDPGSGTARTAGTLHLGETSTLGVAIENYTHNYNDSCSMVFKTTFANGAMTERMRIDSAGNVGIGTTSPIHSLDVYGFGKTIGITSTHSDTTRITHASLSTDTNGYGRLDIFSNVGNPICHLDSNGASYISGGNVGIGATVPTSRLHIANVAADTRAFRISRVEDESVSLLDIFQDSSWEDASGAGQGSGIAHVNTNNRNLAITTSSDQSLDGGMFINADGNVGIGTTSPNTSLHVTSASGNGDGTAFIENTLATYGMGLKVKGGGNVDNQRFALKVQNAAGDDILFAQSKTGNVGIGTTSPTSRLQIEEPLTTEQTTGLFVRNKSSHTANGGATIAGFHNNSDYVMVVKTSGNVGIGTTDPQDDLHVNGTLYASGVVKFENLSASADVQTNSAKQLVTSSDKRLKNDLGNCEYGLNEVLQVQPKKYTWKEGPEDQESTVGFFAQDVHPIMPEAAPREAIQNEKGEDDYKWGFHSQTIIAALVNATKEQQTIIDDLKSRIENLEK